MWKVRGTHAPPTSTAYFPPSPPSLLRSPPGEVLRAWRSRRFELVPGTPTTPPRLAQSRSAGSLSADGPVLSLRGAKVMLEDGGEGRFRIVFADGMAYELEAPDDETRRAWMAAVRLAVSRDDRARARARDRAQAEIRIAAEITQEGNASAAAIRRDKIDAREDVRNGLGGQASAALDAGLNRDAADANQAGEETPALSGEKTADASTKLEAMDTQVGASRTAPNPVVSSPVEQADASHAVPDAVEALLDEEAAAAETSLGEEAAAAETSASPSGPSCCPPSLETGHAAAPQAAVPLTRSRQSSTLFPPTITDLIAEAVSETGQEDSNLSLSGSRGEEGEPTEAGRGPGQGWHPVASRASSATSEDTPTKEAPSSPGASASAASRLDVALPNAPEELSASLLIPGSSANSGTTTPLRSSAPSSGIERVGSPVPSASASGRSSSLRPETQRELTHRGLPSGALRPVSTAPPSGPSAEEDRNSNAERVAAPLPGPAPISAPRPAEHASWLSRQSGAMLANKLTAALAYLPGGVLTTGDKCSSVGTGRPAGTQASQAPQRSGASAAPVASQLPSVRGRAVSSRRKLSLTPSASESPARCETPRAPTRVSNLGSSFAPASAAGGAPLSEPTAPPEADRFGTLRSLFGGAGLLSWVSRPSARDAAAPAGSAISPLRTRPNVAPPPDLDLTASLPLDWIGLLPAPDPALAALAIDEQFERAERFVDAEGDTFPEAVCETLRLWARIARDADEERERSAAATAHATAVADTPDVVDRAPSSSLSSTLPPSPHASVPSAAITAGTAAKAAYCLALARVAPNWSAWGPSDIVHASPETMAVVVRLNPSVETLEDVTAAASLASAPWIVLFERHGGIGALLGALWRALKVMDEDAGSNDVGEEGARGSGVERPLVADETPPRPARASSLGRSRSLGKGALSPRPSLSRDLRSPSMTGGASRPSSTLSMRPMSPPRGFAEEEVLDAPLSLADVPAPLPLASEQSTSRSLSEVAALPQGLVRISSTSLSRSSSRRRYAPLSESGRGSLPGSAREASEERELPGSRPADATGRALSGAPSPRLVASSTTSPRLGAAAAATPWLGHGPALSPQPDASSSVRDPDASHRVPLPSRPGSSSVSGRTTPLTSPQRLPTQRRIGLEQGAARPGRPTASEEQAPEDSMFSSAPLIAAAAVGALSAVCTRVAGMSGCMARPEFLPLLVSTLRPDAPEATRLSLALLAHVCFSSPAHAEAALRALLGGRGAKRRRRGAAAWNVGSDSVARYWRDMVWTGPVFDSAAPDPTFATLSAVLPPLGPASQVRLRPPEAITRVLSTGMVDDLAGDYLETVERCLQFLGLVFAPRETDDGSGASFREKSPLAKPPAGSEEAGEESGEEVDGAGGDAESESSTREGGRASSVRGEPRGVDGLETALPVATPRSPSPLPLPPPPPACASPELRCRLALALVRLGLLPTLSDLRDLCVSAYVSGETDRIKDLVRDAVLEYDGIGEDEEDEDEAEAEGEAEVEMEAEKREEEKAGQEAWIEGGLKNEEERRKPVGGDQAVESGKSSTSQGVVATSPATPAPGAAMPADSHGVLGAVSRAAPAELCASEKRAEAAPRIVQGGPHSSMDAGGSGGRPGDAEPSGGATEEEQERLADQNREHPVRAPAGGAEPFLTHLQSARGVKPSPGCPPSEKDEATTASESAKNTEATASLEPTASRVDNGQVSKGESPAMGTLVVPTDTEAVVADAHLSLAAVPLTLDASPQPQPVASDVPSPQPSDAAGALFSQPSDVGGVPVEESLAPAPGSTTGGNRSGCDRALTDPLPEADAPWLAPDDDVTSTKSAASVQEEEPRVSDEECAPSAPPRGQKARPGKIALPAFLQGEGLSAPTPIGPAPAAPPVYGRRAGYPAGPSSDAFTRSVSPEASQDKVGGGASSPTASKLSPVGMGRRVASLPWQKLPEQRLGAVWSRIAAKKKKKARNASSVATDEDEGDDGAASADGSKRQPKQSLALPRVSSTASVSSLVDECALRDAFACDKLAEPGASTASTFASVSRSLVLSAARVATITSALEALPLPPEEIAGAAAELSSELLRTAADVDSLLVCVPTRGEVALFAAEGDAAAARPPRRLPRAGETLPTALTPLQRSPLAFSCPEERLCAALGRVPRLAQRLRALRVGFEGTTAAKAVEADARAREQFARDAVRSAALEDELERVLDAGNALNRGTMLGAARGFRVAALARLDQVSSTDGQDTLLTYLSRAAYRRGDVPLDKALPAFEASLPSARSLADLRRAAENLLAQSRLAIEELSVRSKRASGDAEGGKSSGPSAFPSSSMPPPLAASSSRSSLVAEDDPLAARAETMIRSASKAASEALAAVTTAEAAEDALAAALGETGRGAGGPVASALSAFVQAQSGAWRAAEAAEKECSVEMNAGIKCIEKDEGDGKDANEGSSGAGEAVADGKDTANEDDTADDRTSSDKRAVVDPTVVQLAAVGEQ